MDSDSILKRIRLLDWLNKENIFSISKYHKNNVVRELETHERMSTYIEEYKDRGFFSNTANKNQLMEGEDDVQKEFDGDQFLIQLHRSIKNQLLN